VYRPPLRRPVHRADKLIAFICRFTGSLGASSSWKPQGLSRPVQGLMYLFFYTRMYNEMSQNVLNLITCFPYLFPFGMKFRSICLHTMLLDFCEFCEKSVQGKAVLFLWSKVTGSQLVKKFPAFNGTRRFIAVFKSAHLS
jgi:hypothetical protein